ncbi:MAG: tryptophan-rich sensory protein [Flavobacterium sp.]
MSYKFYKILLFIATAFMLYCNYLTGSGNYHNSSIGAVSAQYQTLLTPPGYTFGIWSLIFLFQIGFSVYLLVKPTLPLDKIKKVMAVLIVHHVANATWGFLFIDGYTTVALLSIVTQVLCLLYAADRLLSEPNESFTYAKYLAWAPALNLGWVTLATVLNAAIVCLKSGFEFFKTLEQPIAIVMAVVGTAIVFQIFYHRVKTIIVILPALWAFGTRAAESEIPVAIQITLLLCALALVAGYFWKVNKDKLATT